MRHWTELAPGTVVRGTHGGLQVLLVILDPRAYPNTEGYEDMASCYVLWPSWSGRGWRVTFHFTVDSPREMMPGYWEIIAEHK